jgi:hypothetical protein
MQKERYLKMEKIQLIQEHLYRFLLVELTNPAGEFFQTRSTLIPNAENNFYFWLGLIWEKINTELHEYLILYNIFNFTIVWLHMY